jgi:hypothetical protein
LEAPAWDATPGWGRAPVLVLENRVCAAGTP